MKRTIYYLIQNFLLAGFIVCFYCADSWSETEVIVQGELSQITKVLNQLDLKLANTSNSKKKAEILYEKAKLMLKEPDKCDFITVSDLLVRSIESDPLNVKYKRLLFQVYDVIWKRKDFSAGVSTKALKEKIRTILGAYNKNHNFDYLAGPYTVKKVLKQLNEQGTIISYGTEIEKDNVVGYSTEYGWFELEGSYGYYELYIADIDNDGQQEYVITIIDGVEESLTLYGIYKYKDNALIDIYPMIEAPVLAVINEWLLTEYDMQEALEFRGTKFIIDKESGKISFTLVLAPYGKAYEKLGDHLFCFEFVWNKTSIKLVNAYKQ
ncbi:MAG: hypothetical protein ABH869_04745 [Candidatus Omnitrophota bacterium]